MANRNLPVDHASIGGWAKRCYFAGRALMENALRPHGIGTTQWYVLHHLARAGSTLQRELVRSLQIERATLSIIVGTLVRKGLVEQVPDSVDQRQKRLHLTPAGTRLWGELPDLAFIHDTAFAGFSDGDIETATRVLRIATERLNRRLAGDIP